MSCVGKKVHALKKRLNLKLKEIEEAWSRPIHIDNFLDAYWGLNKTTQNPNSMNREF